MSEAKNAVSEKLAKATQLLAEAQLLCVVNDELVWAECIGHGRAYLESVFRLLVRPPDEDTP